MEEIAAASDLQGAGFAGASRPAFRDRALVAAAILVAALALAPGLGRPALIEPDEGRNALVAQEMERRGDLLLPRLEGLFFLDKPFLFFAAEAAAMRLLGSTELAARLPSLLFA